MYLMYLQTNLHSPNIEATNGQSKNHHRSVILFQSSLFNSTLLSFNECLNSQVQTTDRIFLSFEFHCQLENRNQHIYTLNDYS